MLPAQAIKASTPSVASVGNGGKVNVGIGIGVGVKTALGVSKIGLEIGVKIGNAAGVEEGLGVATSDGEVGEKTGSVVTVGVGEGEGSEQATKASSKSIHTREAPFRQGMANSLQLPRWSRKWARVVPFPPIDSNRRAAT